jgi:quercetin dioxygenase-like cupin family protein
MHTSPGSAPAPLVVNPGSGESFTMLGERVDVLASTAGTGGSCFVFIEETAPGHGPPLHRHDREDEFFYILEGSYRFRVNGNDVNAGPGAFLFVPRSSVHTFANVGDRPGRMLIWTVPPAIEPAFRRAAQERLTPADMPRLAEVFAASGVTFLGPPLLAGTAPQTLQRRVVGVDGAVPKEP